MSRKRNVSEMNKTRRDFMWHAACAAVGATAAVSTVWDLRFINAAAAQSLITPTVSGGTGDYKALVCLFLFGGHDANNFLVPVDTTNYNAYASARGSLALPAASLLPISPTTSDGRSYALHPSCPELQNLFNTGKMALLANVGTLLAPINRAQYLAKSVAVPPQLFSHNDQQVQWQTSVPDQPARTGWGGRCADLLHSLNGNANVSMSISLAGTNTFEVGNVVSEYNVSTTGAPKLSGPSSAQVQAIKDLIALSHANLYEQNIANITTTALHNADLLNAAITPTDDTSAGSTWKWTSAFPTSSLGNQLKMIARLIQARTALSHKRQIFFASVSGYDLHSDELDPHAALLMDLSQSLNAFYQATVQLGTASNVTSFTTSDFGRTLPVNGGMGSDHGWGNHQLVMGGAVHGKQIYGNFPTLAVNGPNDTGLGRWIPTTSVDEYSATLAKWFGVSATDIPTVFPNIGRFGTADLGFMG